MRVRSKNHTKVTTLKTLSASFVVDFIDVVTNLVVAAITGSVILLAEALQGMADLTSVTLLLIGYRRSQKKPTTMHPFGYGKELYFWSLLSTFVIMVVTATLSFIFGLEKVLHPHPVEFVGLAYVVLVIAICTNGYALTLSIQRLLEGKPISRLPHTIWNSHQVAPKTTLILDGLGTIAAAFGLIALILYGITGDPRLDGYGAMIIAVTLAIFSAALIISMRSFITGRRAPQAVERRIRKAARDVPGVLDVLDLRTMALGSNSTLINIEVHLQDDLTTDQIEQLIDRIKANIVKAVPGKAHVQVEPETPRSDRTHRSDAKLLKPDDK